MTLGDVREIPEWALTFYAVSAHLADRGWTHFMLVRRGIRVPGMTGGNTRHRAHNDNVYAYERDGWWWLE